MFSPQSLLLEIYTSIQINQFETLLFVLPKGRLLDLLQSGYRNQDSYNTKRHLVQLELNNVQQAICCCTHCQVEQVSMTHTIRSKIPKVCCNASKNSYQNLHFPSVTNFYQSPSHKQVFQLVQEPEKALCSVSLSLP